MHRLLGLRKRLFATLALFSLLFNIFQPAIVVAQEASSSTPIESPTPAPTPSLDPSSSPVPSIEPSTSPSPSPEAIIEPSTSPSPSPEATTEPSPSPSDTPQNSPVPTDSSPAPSTEPSSSLAPSPNPSYVPTATPAPVIGELQTTIVENTSASSIEEFDLTINEEGSATLATDKLDYAPTDTAVITGSGFEPGDSYSLTISSSDDPATSTTISVTADDDGKIFYAYQLDGQYRPNYKVEAKDSAGRVVATTTFTDHANFDIKINNNDTSTSSFDVTLQMSWSTGWLSGSDPTQARYANDTNGGNCNNLGLGSWTEWETIIDLGGNHGSKNWSLYPGGDGDRKVCVETKHGNNTTLSASDSINYFTLVTNPILSAACGLDISLVIDNSNSISATELGQMKTALKAFVSALSGTPTQFSVTRFATSADILQSFTNDSSNINSAIDSVSTNGGGTDWEEGIRVARSTFDPRSDKPNLMIFATDGNPTFPGNGSDTTPENVAAAVAEANITKNYPIRILALGIGNNLNLANLQAISGPTVGTNLSADVITSDFATLASTLATFASSTCGGTITVRKYLDNTNTPAGANWQFTLWGDNAPATTYSTDTFGLTEAIPVSAGSYTVIESTMLPGYSYGSSVCHNSSGAVLGTPISTPSGPGLTGVVIGATDIVTCDFINNTVPTTGSISGHKINDVNRNGISNPGDSPVPNWQIFIDGNNNQSYDPGETITTTNDSGDYTFPDLPYGTYTFCEVMQPNWASSPHTRTCYTETIDANTPDISGKDFYNYQVGYLTFAKDIVPNDPLWYSIGVDNLIYANTNVDWQSGILLCQLFSFLLVSTLAF